MRPRAFEDESGAWTAEPELLLGPLALALAARAAIAGRLPGLLRDDEPVHLVCRGAALSTAARRALEEQRLLAPGPRSGLAAVVGPRPRLADLAPEHGEARVLLAAWDAARRPPVRRRVMGVLNLTPDSFSDGGLLRSAGEAVAHGLKLLAEGAEILDVGGESTRPGARPVPLEEERERVLPVVAALARETGAVVGVDTRKAALARDALDLGARLVNDVSAGRDDPDMLPLVAERDADLVLMHRRGTPEDMQRDPRYADVVDEVAEHLRARVAAAWSAGVALPRIAIDPGIGFGKRLHHNLELLRALPELRSLGRPIVCGLSRKAFLGALGGEVEPSRRGPETVAATAIAAALGAEVHRVHEAGEARRALSVAAALAGTSGAPGDPEGPVR